ncbi:Tyrosine-protein kinase wzc [Rubripirellula tenax]|uniref:Tyrosine-protein kinase wzc n=2 Tax=Rubripirellula tenax TaxID=2528015 RepID=A0A5C6FG23_9BACT|nr:Tyrosine-protein kinase wzc [Rubripirellula tenax]
MMGQPKYVAESYLRVREQQDVIFSAQTSRSEDSAFFRSQTKLVRSPQVLAAAVKDPSVVDYVSPIRKGLRVKWLDDKLKAEAQTGSETLTISVEHPDPVASQTLCNAVTKAYLAEIVCRLEHDRTEREEQLELAAKQADADLDASWEKLNRIAEGLGSDTSQSLTLRDEMQFQAYRDYSRRLQAAQLRGSQLQAQLSEKQHGQQHTSTSVEATTEALLHANPEVVAARKRLLSLNLQIDAMRNIAASETSPKLLQLRQQQQFLLNDLAELETATRSKIAVDLQSRSQSDFQHSVDQLKVEIELNRSEKTFLREQLSEFQIGSNDTSTRTAVPLDMSRHEVSRQSHLADRLWQSLQELQIESQSQPRVSLIELASRPEFANNSYRKKYTVFAGLLAWVIVVYAIGVMEWYDCRVRDADDIVSHSSYPVFGAAPYMRPESSGGITSFFRTRQNSVRTSDGVREAVARIILRNEDASQTISLMITSCHPKEPRHLVSQEIAILLASHQRRVLLIDCDIDGGVLSRAAGASNVPGIRSLPVNKPGDLCSTVAQYIVATQHDLLDFLPVGTTTTPSSWVAPHSLRSTIASVGSEYDAVIVNGPSFLGSAESVLFAAEVDQSLFATFVNVSRWDLLSLCEEAASDAAIPVCGSIVHSGKFAADTTVKISNVPGRKTIPSRHRVQNVATESIHSSQSIDDSVERDLRRQIHELRNAIRSAQPESHSEKVAESNINSHANPDTAET